MMPSEKIAACSYAPPTNMLNMPKSVLLPTLCAPMTDGSTPGTEMNEPTRTISSIRAVNSRRSRSSSMLKALRRLSIYLLAIDGHGTAGLLDLRTSSLGHFVGGDGELRGELAVAEDLHRQATLGDHAEGVERVGRDDAVGDAAGIGQFLQARKVDRLVLHPERVDEPEFRHAADQGHLASLEALAPLVTGSGLLSLMTLCRCAATSGTLTASDALASLRRAVGRAERPKMIRHILSVVQCSDVPVLILRPA